MSSPRPSRGLGCRELWREGAGGRRSPGSPAHHPTPPRPGGWEARSVPGARAWPRRVPGCAPGAAGSEGLPPGLVSGAPFGLREPAGPGLHAGLGQGAPVCALPAAALGLGPGSGSGSHGVNPERVRTQRRGAGGRGTPVPSSAAARVRASPSSSLRTRLDLGPSPTRHFSGELCEGDCGRLGFPSHSGPLHCLSGLYIPAWEGRPERWCGSVF